MGCLKLDVSYFQKPALRVVKGSRDDYKTQVEEKQNHSRRLEKSEVGIVVAGLNHTASHVTKSKFSEDPCPVGQICDSFGNVIKPTKHDGPTYIGGTNPLLELIGGPVSGAVQFLKHAPKGLSLLKSTEIGAQSATKINKFVEIFKTKGVSAISEPIYTYVHKGTEYILNGHHRVQAGIIAGKSLDVIRVSRDAAVKYGDDLVNKISEIHKGLH